MFYKVLVKDNIRVSPEHFDKEKKEAILEEIKKEYTGYISKELGIVIDVIGVKEIGEGIIIPGDGAAYYNTSFEIMVFQAEQHEIIPGKIRDITDFGAFINLGPVDGMIHISQTMNDFVSLTKEKVLQGKETKRVLKVNDKVHAKIVAISYKDITNAKFGLTMRQEGLGKEEWIEEDLNKEKKSKKKNNNSK